MGEAVPYPALPRVRRKRRVRCAVLAPGSFRNPDGDHHRVVVVGYDALALRAVWTRQEAGSRRP